MPGFAKAGVWGPVPFQNSQGVELTGTLTVYTDSARTIKATLYTDQTAGTTAPNPVSPDTLGNFTVYAAPGLYYGTFTHGGTSTNTLVTVTSAGGSSVPTFTVTDYGAKGDGVTDDTAAIQAAITAAYTAGGGTVQFPAGTYVLTSELTPTGTAHINLVGVKWGVPVNATGSWGTPPTSGTILKQTGSGANGIHINRQINGITIRDIAIQFTQNSTGHGIFFDPVTFLSGTSPGFTGLFCALNVELSNLLVYGHDSSHYAYYFGNIVNARMSFLNGSGLGGFYKFFQYHPSGASATVNFGNTVMDGYWQHCAPTGQTYNPGVAVVSYENQNNTTAGTPALNYIQHKGVLDIVLNHNLSSNLFESTSTGSHSGTLTQLTIDNVQMQDLGSFTCPVANNGGLFIGFKGETMATLQWNNQLNQRYEYSPVFVAGSLNGSAPGNACSGNSGLSSAGLFRLSSSLNVHSFVSGTINATASYTSAIDSLSKTQTLCTLTGNGETGGSTVAYVQPNTTITIAVAGVFSASVFAFGSIERLAN